MLKYVKMGAKQDLVDYIKYMVLGRKRIGMLISLIVISLAGLIFFQGLLLRDAIQSREQTFNNNVAIALNSTNELIEAHHAATVIIDVTGDIQKLDSVRITVNADDHTIQDTLKSKLIVIKADTVLTKESSIDSTTFKHIIQSGKLDSICIDDLRSCTDTSIINTDQYQLSVANDSTGNIIKIIGAVTNNRVEFVQKILNQLWISEIIPIESRLDSALIDSSLAQSLNDVNIDLDYVFGVKLGESDSVIMSSADYINNLMNSNYKSSLFPFDVVSKKAELLLYFPDRQVYLWKQILPMLLIIGVFMLIIIATFTYTIKVILMQKRNETLMADFVNNMTHEFKTPISTIALATEAILRKDMISDNEKVTRFSKMIRDENKRMQHQAEKILHMASMENGDITLKLDPVDIHQVIRESIDNISLSIQNNNGSVSFDDKANNSIIHADKVHLVGIINNLLDNAVKYSPDKPEIYISTLNANDGIYIRISDKGIGISKSDLKMVFNKYFRVSSGNIHDVKGFGLGLSYVKLMVEAHGGTVDIKSQSENGTRVELFFPQ
ncbi:MAG: HAMP domain-containing histidine kinase [candidate division Zixibacteria bacterium]|nr:HAMP domain-containing histidine kinase [candidate division Zixibacteria bacterium]